MTSFCGALFETPAGTGVCEAFGDHERHAGCVTVGVFRCHDCRRRIGTYDQDRCRCVRPSGQDKEPR